MVFTANDFKRRDELQGAPDPFPSLDESASTSVPTKNSPREELDTSSQLVFPSLAPSTPLVRAPTRPVWGTAAGPRIKAAVSKNPVFTDSFTLSAIDLSTAGKDGRPATLGEVMKQVMVKYKVKIEASANQKTRQTTFHLRTESQKDLDKAKRSLLALLSPIITLVINAPASTIASIIGPKGATLKQIRDQTSVRVDIPRKDSLAPPQASRANSVLSSGTNTPVPDDDEDEPTVPVTLTGPQPLAHEAKALLNQIITSKTSKTTQRVRDIPKHILPFVAARRSAFLAAAEGGDVTLSLNAPQCEITASGDRQAVTRVVETIKSTVEMFKTGLTSLTISMPKRQHRLLVGAAADEIMKKSKCSVAVTKPEDPSEGVTVWGLATDLPTGLGAVMEQANSKYIHEFPLPGPIALSKQLLRYLTCIGYPKSISPSNPGVAVYFPTLSAAEKMAQVNVDIVGDKPAVDAVVRQISEMIGKLIGATKDLTIDWLVHRVLTGKHAKKLKQFHEAHNIQVFFPPEADEDSSVLLVYDPLSPTASPSPIEKQKHLEEVSKELLKLAKDAADVKSQIVAIEKKLHDAVVGKGGTTLNAIIGEDKTLSIKVGAEAGASTEDVILVRGASADVDRAVLEILKIVEDAKNDEIVKSYSVEFDVDREYVGRIVGAQGSGVNKLRDQLGVNVDVSDEVDDKEKESGGKKKKAVHQKSKVKITGRKENVEEAKKRILAQIDRLADETSEVLKIPGQYHSSLIGQSGKYAIRLEEKYSVKITFPRHSHENGGGGTREQLKPDEVLVKGGKKGVAGARSELMEAVEFEKECNNVLKFTVPTRSVACILGRGGATINEIKDNTDAQIDVDKALDETGAVTQITVRGTKEAVAAAKAAILAISEQVGEETTMSVTIDSKFHRALIGAGGQGLRELVARCGGPSDPKRHAGLIRFPRPGEPLDEVLLRGDPILVKKIRDELEKTVDVLRDRVLLAVEIPMAQHRTIIGRGGQNLKDFQIRTGVQLQFPGSRSYSQIGEPTNAADLVGADPADIVKVSGPSNACELAIEELKANIKSFTPEEMSAVVAVPLKYHHVISQQGNFFRNLRSFGVQVDQSALPARSAVPPRPPQAGAGSARIDDSNDAEGAPEIQWETTENYRAAEEGDSQWTLKARDQPALDKAQQLIKAAIDHAQAMSHVGFLTLPDRSAFPRIVGTRGANVIRLRAETGAEITVSRENSTIVIIGTEDAILSAKESIIQIASNSRRQRRYD